MHASTSSSAVSRAVTTAPAARRGPLASHASGAARSQRASTSSALSLRHPRGRRQGCRVRARRRRPVGGAAPEHPQVGARRHPAAIRAHDDQSGGVSDVRGRLHDEDGGGAAGRAQGRGRGDAPRGADDPVRVVAGGGTGRTEARDYITPLHATPLGGVGPSLVDGSMRSACDVHARGLCSARWRRRECLA